MASLEIRFSFALFRPEVIQPGSEIKGRVFETTDTDRRIKLSAYFSPDNKLGSVNAEILGVEHRLILGPIKLMEKRTVLDNITTTVRRGQTQGVRLAADQKSDCYWMFVKHTKRRKAKNLAH